MTSVPTLLNDPPTETQRAIARETLRRGGIIAHPTETVYGLGADPFHPEALQRILSLKGRDAAKGFILLIPDRPALDPLVAAIPVTARRLMEHFWPGPLTLILPARPGLPAPLTGGRSTLAVRHSSSRHVTTLLEFWNRPLVSTSANRSGAPPLRDGKQVIDLFGAEIDCLQLGHCPPDTPPSTIVAFDEKQPRIIRMGTITQAMIRAVLG
ncbi:MAG: threonylcarbamoyl-AMP synthase [Magnetococcales bacterium]|nr:threonylcarbamoyl-AMP synthase [Magnetococcales bacterium]